MAFGHISRAFSPATTIRLSHQRQLYYLAKRAVDIVVSGLVLLLLLPLLVLITLLIVLDSPGPAIFQQKRVGSKRRYDGDEESWKVTDLVVYKFRTMHNNSDQSLHKNFIEAFANGDIDTAVDQTAKFKLDNDPRVTRVGRFPRNTSLDELPQLINVLKGDMSLVGPRPVPDYEADHYTAKQRQRLRATPGITGLWQVLGRSQVSFEEMIRLDIEYVRNQSLWLDLKILMLTIPAVLTGHGAR